MSSFQVENISRASAPSPTYRSERQGAIVAFESILMRAAFAPLGKALGYYGDVAVAAVVDSFVRAEPAR